MNTNKKWVESHPEENRKKSRESLRRQRAKVLKLLGRRCAYCGFSDPRALQIDHILGGGAKERRALNLGKWGGGSGLWRLILKMSKEDRALKYQILCANCNWIKRYGEDGLGIT
jgi:hypothetical protein